MIVCEAGAPWYWCSLGIAMVNKVTPVSNYAVALLIFAACLVGVWLIHRLLPQTKLVLG